RSKHPALLPPPLPSKPEPHKYKGTLFSGFAFPGNFGTTPNPDATRNPVSLPVLSPTPATPKVLPPIGLELAVRIGPDVLHRCLCVRCCWRPVSPPGARGSAAEQLQPKAPALPRDPAAGSGLRPYR